MYRHHYRLLVLFIIVLLIVYGLTLGKRATWMHGHKEDFRANLMYSTSTKKTQPIHLINGVCCVFYYVMLIAK